MSEYAIRVKNVSKVYKLFEGNKDRVLDALSLSKKKRYKEHYALNNMNFDIARGETVGIIGTNGAGKSTILKIITGVLSPTDGEVEINGRISALLELGAGFNMEYTGIENIYLNGTMIGFTREEIDERLDDILAFADIGDFVYQPVKTYSSGMFVRLAFAVAINIDPEILIVDEALSVGDVFFQAKCYKKFEDFKKMGKTILFVSHDLTSIARYCDKVILLDHGRKLDEGTPKEMVGLYKRILAGKNPSARGVMVSDESGVVSSDSERNDDTTDAQNRNGVTESAANNEILWKTNYDINPNVDEYGNGEAEIIDFAVMDDLGDCSNNIVKGSTFTIKSKVRFNNDVVDPIFTYTIKNIHGTAITGTNTMFERVSVGTAKTGETYVASFEQEMNLQGGEYLLSISCTGYKEGELIVYHRLYDVINITVISDKNTVGFYDMNSVTSIEKV
ncbi:MAG: ABC transporter ATP-binding protein [Lachnospiraceae bacterium]|nr:ABC transporter ATP-binding protein [Lachnospiraceae bacterium]